jgi:hypothetical protein
MNAETTPPLEDSCSRINQPVYPIYESAAIVITTTNMSIKSRFSEPTFKS